MKLKNSYKLGIVLTLLTVSLSGCVANGLPSGCNPPSSEIENVRDSISSQEKWAEKYGTIRETNWGFNIENRTVLTYPKCFMREYVEKYEEVWGPANWNDDPNY